MFEEFVAAVEELPGSDQSAYQRNPEGRGICIAWAMPVSL
jgi:hypothetical protein